MEDVAAIQRIGRPNSYLKSMRARLMADIKIQDGRRKMLVVIHNSTAACQSSRVASIANGYDDQWM